MQFDLENFRVIITTADCCKRSTVSQSASHPRHEAFVPRRHHACYFPLIQSRDMLVISCRERAQIHIFNFVYSAMSVFSSIFGTFYRAMHVVLAGYIATVSRACVRPSVRLSVGNVDIPWAYVIG